MLPILLEMVTDLFPIESASSLGDDKLLSLILALIFQKEKEELSDKSDIWDSENWRLKLKLSCIESSFIVVHIEDLWIFSFLLHMLVFDLMILFKMQLF